MTILDNFQKLSQDVEIYFEALRESAYYQAIAPFYRGEQILFSNILHKPEIMFIGINPGAGFYNDSGQFVRKYLPEQKLEYSYPYRYDLAIETRYVMESIKIGREKYENFVKSNFYFIATPDEKSLNKVIEILDPLDFELKSKMWINQLVAMVEPKILICEGTSAFKKYIEDKQIDFYDKGSLMIGNWQNMSIVGYRRRYSKIRNKEELIEYLKQII